MPDGHDHLCAIARKRVADDRLAPVALDIVYAGYGRGQKMSLSKRYSPSASVDRAVAKVSCACGAALQGRDRAACGKSHGGAWVPDNNCAITEIRPSGKFVNWCQIRLTPPRV